MVDKVLVKVFHTELKKICPTVKAQIQGHRQQRDRHDLHIMRSLYTLQNHVTNWSIISSYI
jgi:hypothetical protein